MTLEQLIHQVYELIGSSHKIPLLNRCLIDEEVLMDLIDAMDQTIPVEIRQAQEILAMRDNLLTEARREAEEIKTLAERQRAQLLSETEIYRQATQEADRLLRDAQRRNHEVQSNADLYADEVLAELETKIGRALHTIQNGRTSLQGALSR